MLISVSITNFGVAETVSENEVRSAYLTLEKSTPGQKEYNDKLKTLQDYAAKGSFLAQKSLGDFYFKGKSLPYEERKKAVGYYVQAAQSNDPVVYDILGGIYRDGVLVKTNYEMAVECYRKAADLGDIGAKIDYSMLLIQGRGVKADPEVGLANIESIAASGNAEAYKALGRIYSQSIGMISVNADKAIESFEKAAQLGDAGGYILAGDIYRDGNLVQKNTSKAYEYYVMARDAGNGLARIRVAEALIRGSGVKQDVQAGLAVLEDFATKGNGDANRALGDLYSIPGSPLPLDGLKAIGYYEQAVKAGNTALINQIGALYRDGSLVPVDQAKAFGYFEQAMQEGDIAAQSQVAEAYIKGYGVAVDIDKGMELLRQAADRGSAGALQSLGNYLVRGDFVKADPIQGIKLIEEARNAGSNYANLLLAQIYRDGISIPRNPKKSIAYFEQAVATGQPGAELMLAQSHVYRVFGSVSDRKKGLAMLKKLVNNGDEEAVVMMANVLYNGSGVSPQPQKAVAMLKEAADKGNLTAARRLIALYRDAPGAKIQQSLTKAREILNSISSKIGPANTARENILLELVFARSVSDFERIESLFWELPTSARFGVFTVMPRMNPNAYTYILQKSMASQNLYNGKLNGLLTGPTVRAIQDLCARGANPGRCSKGPLDFEAVHQAAAVVLKSF
jgi:TPR repeat protein